MSRRDPGAASGGAVDPRAIPVCACRHLTTLHRLVNGKRTGCSASDCRCTNYQQINGGEG
ncbi:MAG TPA: hypothetical protein VIQ30_09780 [Pseudonocardia sp.]